jgi:protein-S-isoprenylcysteine O-methyltransferase Ste14
MKFLRAILFFVATGLLYLGVPLLGWGLGDLGGYFSNAPHLGYALVIGLFSLAVGIQAFSSTEGIRGNKGQEGKLIFRQTLVRITLELSLYLTLFFIPSFDRHAIGVFNAPEVIRWLGVALSALGYALIFLSGLALGKQYSADVTIQKDHQLIMTGVYRLIRHPRYLGIIALAAGLPLVFRSWIGLIACILFILVLLFRIKDEEMVLHKEFGVEWEDYCMHSWRLLPYIC